MKILHPVRFCAPVLLAFVMGYSNCAQAEGLVMPIKRRTAILNSGERYLRTLDPQVEGQLAGLEYPFAFKAEEAPKPVQDEEEASEPVVVAYTDQQVLEAFSSKFHPTGMVARGEVNYLIIQIGEHTRPVAEGSLIRFNYEDKSYGVRLGSVTDDQYTLRLGEATIVRRINESYDSDKIKRFTPNPE